MAKLTSIKPRPYPTPPCQTLPAGGLRQLGRNIQPATHLQLFRIEAEVLPKLFQGIKLGVSFDLDGSQHLVRAAVLLYLPNLPAG